MAGREASGGVKGVDALRLFSEPITATMLKSLGAEV
jgi:hypothetical protein